MTNEKRAWRGRWLASGLAAIVLATPVIVSAVIRDDKNTNDGSKATGTWKGTWYHLWVRNGWASLDVPNTNQMNADWDLRSPGGNSVLGIGWPAGQGRLGPIWYNLSQFTAGSGPGKSNSFVAFYGWTRNYGTVNYANPRIIEYYVVENWGEWKPSCVGQDRGTYTIEGEGTYRLYRCDVTNRPSLWPEFRDFTQYYAVRESKRSLGTNNKLSFGAHNSAWRAKGHNLGQLDFQIMKCEGYQSDGKCSLGTWR